MRTQAWIRIFLMTRKIKKELLIAHCAVGNFFSCLRPFLHTMNRQRRGQVGIYGCNSSGGNWIDSCIVAPFL